MNSSFVGRKKLKMSLEVDVAAISFIPTAKFIEVFLISFLYKGSKKMIGFDLVVREFKLPNPILTTLRAQS